MQRHQRLTGEKRFASIHKEGRAWANRHLVLKALPNGLEDSRFGFSTSRRVGNAVIRNRVKRRLREVLRASPVKTGWDVVVIGRSPAGAAGFHELKASLQDLLRRAKLIAPASSEGLGGATRAGGPCPPRQAPVPPDRSKRC